MSDNITRYELPPAGITLLGYVVRRMHKTQWLTLVPELISAGKADEALAQVAIYAVTSSTSFGHAYYQPQFDSVGTEVSEADPKTGTTVGLRGLGMPAPSKFNFKSGNYSADLTGILTSELALSLIGRTRIRAYGFLNFNDNANNTEKLTIDRNHNIKIEINGKAMGL